jgi:hypothetical protein
MIVCLPRLLRTAIKTVPLEGDVPPRLAVRLKFSQDWHYLGLIPIMLPPENVENTSRASSPITVSSVATWTASVFPLRPVARE